MILLINGNYHWPSFIHIKGAEEHRSLCGRHMAWKEQEADWVDPAVFGKRLCSFCYGHYLLDLQEREERQRA